MIDCPEALSKWRLAPELVGRLLEMEVDFRIRTGRELTIISGFRTQLDQQRLRSEGRPAAPDELSTHRICPATGADLQINGMVTRSLKIAFGESAVINRLRWGGGSPVDDGIPSDWNHVDLGPRMDRVAREYRERNG